MTAAVRVTEEERDELAEFIAETLAPRLAWARRAGDAEEIAVLLTPLSRQELYALCLVQAEHWPLPPSPLVRAEDGTFDEITVARVAGGQILPLTMTERNAVIRLMRRRGVTFREIGAHLGVSKSLVWKVATAPVPEQTELFGEAS